MDTAIDPGKQLILGQRFTDRVFDAQFKEGEFLLPDAEVLVRRKGEVHFVRANQIGDGMQLIYVYPRERLQAAAVLDGSLLLAGMSIYHEYDEEKDKTTVYLYKHAKDAEELEYINSILATYQLVARAEQEGRFVILQLEGNTRPIVSALGDPWSFVQHLSFFLGLLLAYPSGGSIMEQKKELTTRKSTIPLVGSIASYEKQIWEVVASLQREGIFVTIVLQKEKIWSVLQLTVTDREVVSLLGELLGEKATPARSEFFETTLKAVVKTKKPDLALKHSVLKMITK